MNFKLSSEYAPTGDQPEAIAQLKRLLDRGSRHNTLLGVTGSGKTFTVANVIDYFNRPVLVLSHNKTLAAQLYGEFKNFFPDNAVEYFVSYYDYYQPEAYLPTTDTYIEKDLAINNDIEKLRLRATTALLSGRRDVIIVASVSCIYGIGNPADFKDATIILEVGKLYDLNTLIYKFVESFYTRTELDLQPGTFRVNGETIDIMNPYSSEHLRLSFCFDELESIHVIDENRSDRARSLYRAEIYPAKLFATSKDRLAEAIGRIYVDMGARVKELESMGREVEAQRLRQRVEYDLEMIKELGYCSGIENYSRYFDGRDEGEPPFCLIDYFPKDFITVIDESHVTLPQIRAMYGGDRSRKENLVEHGFRLPAAIDNRPLKFEEFENRVGSRIYVSATPGVYELQKCEGFFVEQLIRPTGLIDPPMSIHDADDQIDDVMEAIQHEVASENKVIITTITKRMAEELSKYFDRTGVRNRYIHSDVETLERVQILEDLRAGLFDVLIGVNLIREGLDIPEVSLVVILDADKEGFLRNITSITQIAGRAARHKNGRSILYATICTDSMRKAITDSTRRRMRQIRYNLKSQQMPKMAVKSGDGQSQLLATKAETEQAERLYPVPGEAAFARVADSAPQSIENLDNLIATTKQEMEAAAKRLDFLAASRLRDRVYELQKLRENS
ncbi:MAG: excinuclease ABC subunit UvrB [Rikenellaceae bacterium]